MFVKLQLITVRLCEVTELALEQQVAVWCSGNALVLINAVALHQARLVLAMGDCLRAGELSHYVTCHPGQLSLAIPPWVGVMSTGDGYGHR